MSKASRQSLALLATVSGAMKMIERESLSPELLPTVVYTGETVDKCVYAFPCTGDEGMNLKWIEERMAEWQDTLNTIEGNWTAIILVSIAHQIMEDLTVKIKNKNKLKLIAPAEEALQGLSDLLDPEGTCYEAYVTADRLVADMYSRLEFTL